MKAKSKSAKPKGGAEPDTALDLLESKFSNALELLSSNRAADALRLFEAVAAEASDSGNYGMARAAGNYIAHQKHKKDTPPKADPLQEAVFLLNGRQAQAALENIDKVLKKAGKNANVHYLKAIALASARQPSLSAESLKTAIELEPELLQVYRLEPEFRPYRNSPSFESFERA